ncbi:MAG: beta-eliminating lyase-related protein [Actinomycetota bacterium]|nr:beta-eliminating lyase-related protein [Actinomycetota bacterium]
MSEFKVDLRSDTVTRPTPAMRRAMAEAEVGDDLYGEDPTVARLEALYAEMVGKEAGLFVPSGVMANQIAIRTHTRPGSFVVAGKSQHVVVFEYGGSARNAGVQFMTVDDSTGSFGAADVQEARSALGYYEAPLSLICVENTHMPSGGRVWSLEALADVRRVAGDLPVHMDGARLFNAQVASGVSAARISSVADSVMSCVSKGLCAPVGSVLAGSREFIEKARYERGVLGGQMRQVGILAAAGLVALETMVDRLAEDHERARVLAETVNERFPGSMGDVPIPETNIVAVYHPDVDRLSQLLAEAGVIANPIGNRRMRLVTHHDLTDEQVAYAAKVIRALDEA